MSQNRHKTEKQERISRKIIEQLEITLKMNKEAVEKGVVEADKQRDKKEDEEKEQRRQMRQSIERHRLEHVCSTF